MPLKITKNKLRNFESILSTLVLGCALIVVALLGVRQLTSVDLGYHLAFGETFFDTGTIVDHTSFIYTLPPLDTPVHERPEPGPGSWYDSEGRYRFTNSSWLSQVFIYGTWKLADDVGLNLLQILIAAGLAVTLIVVMRRSKVPPYLIALALLLIGLLLNSRLNIRPELFGYLCLAVQYLMLARLSLQDDNTLRVPSWAWVCVMLIVQLLAINFHSYFLLGLAITGAVFTEYLLGTLKNRFVKKDIAKYLEYKKVVKRLSITLIGMVLVCFINPWGWRLVLQPIQTLLYMKKYDIGGPNPESNAHPWDHILELRATISENWPMIISDYAVITMVALVVSAMVIQLALMIFALYQKNKQRENSQSFQNTFKMRWGHLFMMAGMLYVGLQMRRNIGVAGLIAVPSALICIVDSSRYFLAPKNDKMRLILSACTNIAVVVLCIYGGSQVITGKIYKADRFPAHFGFGVSKTMLPIGASFWLNEYAPEARVWCDFSSSSTVRFFTNPHKDLPVLSNTWAYPAEVMAMNRQYREARASFNQLANDYDIDAVVLRSDWSLPLHRQLGADPDWKIVHVEGVHVLYLRSNQRYKVLADKYEMRQNNFDVGFLVKQQLKKDSDFNRAILSVSYTFENAGELGLAMLVISNALESGYKSETAWHKLLQLNKSQVEHSRFVEELERNVGLELDSAGIKFHAVEPSLTMGGRKVSLHLDDSPGNAPVTTLFIFNSTTLMLEKIKPYIFDKGLSEATLGKELLLYKEKLVLVFSRAKFLAGFSDPDNNPSRGAFFIGKPGSDLFSTGPVTGDLIIPFDLLVTLSQGKFNSNIIDERENLLRSIDKVNSSSALSK